MKQLTSFEEFRWIEEGILELMPSGNPDWNGNFVAHCLPSAFSSYAKILHPMYEDLELIGTTTSWDQEDKLLRQLKEPAEDPTLRRIDELISSATLMMKTGTCPESGRRIRWKELADRLGLRFHSEINASSFSQVFPNGSWPRHLIGPAEGDLAIEHCAHLINMLTTFTQPQPCYFKYIDYATHKCEPLIFRGQLDDIYSILKHERVRTSPTWWWPSDRSWCVNTDWDLTFSLVGGPEHLIAKLLIHPELECIRVTSQTRIDWKSGEQTP